MVRNFNVRMRVAMAMISLTWGLTFALVLSANLDSFMCAAIGTILVFAGGNLAVFAPNLWQPAAVVAMYGAAIFAAGAVTATTEAEAFQLFLSIVIICVGAAAVTGGLLAY